MIKFRVVRRLPILIAPRGEFSPGALDLKPWKKRSFIFAAKIVGLYRDVVWQASSELEALHIRAIFGGDANVIVVPNIASRPDSLHLKKNIKAAGSLRVIFFSRICKKKNIAFALNVLKRVSAPVIFDIYGPIEDEAYWKKCLGLMAALPKTIQVQYCGALHPDSVFSTFSQYDLFFLPTMGENYGHVIAEALLSNLPVLISDQTPWSDIQAANAGWSIPLYDEAAYVDVIEMLASFSGPDYEKLIGSVVKYIDHKKVLFDNVVDQQLAVIKKFAANQEEVVVL